MQTATAATPTQTLTDTPRPTRTITKTSQPTSTILLLVPTYTQVELSLPDTNEGDEEEAVEGVTATSTPNNEHNYKGTLACSLVKRDPPSGTVFRPRKKFTVRWTIKNTGTASWKKGWFDYQYLGGDKFHDRGLYNMNYILDPGETIEIKVVMYAPKKPGNYETTWIFGSKKNSLCKLTLAIVVK